MSLDERTIRNQAATDDFNNAVLAIRQGDRKSAIVHYQTAFDLLGEVFAPDRAFKAIVAYQYGVCLMKLHNLDEERNLAILSGVQQEAANKIRNLWQETIRLYSTLDASTIGHYSRLFPPGLALAVDAIVSDPLMQQVGGTDHLRNVETLLEDAYSAFIAKNVDQLLHICEKGIGLPNISGQNEAAFRKLYAFALYGLSLQENKDKVTLRQKAVDEAKKSITLYGNSANKIALAQAYEIYADAAKLYSIALTDTNQKDQALRESISAYEQALQLTPNNSDVQKHLQDTRKILQIALEDEQQNFNLSQKLRSNAQHNEKAPSRGTFPTSQAKPKYSCPKCNSEQITSCEMVWNSGTFNEKHETVGWSPGTGVLLAQTTGVSRSLLADKIRPPAQPKGTNGCLIIFVGAVAYAIVGALMSINGGGSRFLPIAIAVGIIVGVSFLIYTRMKLYENLQKYGELLRIWKNTFMCQRCGHIWIIKF